MNIKRSNILPNRKAKKGDKKMKKKLFVVIAVILLLAVASISAGAAASAGKEYAEGVWCYLPTGLKS